MGAREIRPSRVLAPSLPPKAVCQLEPLSPRTAGSRPGDTALALHTSEEALLYRSCQLLRTPLAALCTAVDSGFWRASERVACLSHYSQAR